MHLVNKTDQYLIWVEVKPVNDLYRVAFYTQWLDAKDPEALQKKFEMFLPLGALYDLGEYLKD